MPDQSNDAQFQATIIITTFNRKADLEIAVKSALSQDVPCELMVVDDCSTDGTPEMIESNYPMVRLIRSKKNYGLIVQRSRAAALALSPIIFSIDDDAEFSQPSIVRETLTEFNDPRVGAVAIPFINVKYNSDIHQKAPDVSNFYLISQFIGTAYALRKDLFLSLGGYKEIFFHQGEEQDFCVRMYEKKKVVKVGSASPIFHYESPNRNRPLISYHRVKNDVLFAWYNVPTMALLPHLLGNIKNHVLNSFRTKYFWQSFKGFLRGMTIIATGKIRREPVSLKTYRLFRYLRKHGITEIGLLDKLSPLGEK
jgi:glycosyltransferase involved in cell wall biosynthesis